MSKTTSAIATIDSNLFPALNDVQGVQELMLANVGEGERIGFSDLVRIKMPSGETPAFSVPNIETGIDDMLPEIQGIIVHWHPQRAFWPKSISEGGDPMPLCHSNDGVIGMGHFKPTPDGGYEELEEGTPEVKYSCSSCPMAQYESAPDGKRQWCKSMRRLFIMRQGEILPTVMTMPPSSIKPCKTFFSQLTSRAIPYYLCSTAIGLMPDEAERVGDKGKVQKIKYMKASFRVSGMLTDEQKTQMRAFRNFILPMLQSFVENDIPAATEAE